MTADPVIIRPANLARPVGYSHGITVRGGETLYVAGQVAFDADGKVVGAGNIVKQFEQALANFCRVLEAAGAAPMAAYKANLKTIGQVYRAVFGSHYPAMTLVEVKSLYDDGILVEIEGIAVLESNAECGMQNAE